VDKWVEGVEASSNKEWGNLECGRSGCAEGQTSARHRAAAFLSCSCSRSCGRGSRSIECESDVGVHSPSPSLSTMCPCSCSCSGDVSDAGYAYFTHPTRGGGACTYPAVMGVQVEANDVAAAGMCSSMSAPAGYIKDTDTDTVSGSYCCWCVCGCSSCTLCQLFRAGTPATSHSEKTGYCRKGRTSVRRRRASWYIDGSSPSS
jgi:hypothetical protein